MYRAKNAQISVFSSQLLKMYARMYIFICMYVFCIYMHVCFKYTPIAHFSRIQFHLNCLDITARTILKVSINSINTLCAHACVLKKELLLTSQETSLLSLYCKPKKAYFLDYSIYSFINWLLINFGYIEVSIG